MNKIYCFCNGGQPGWREVVAIAESGDCVGSHVCSHEYYFKHDIGITSDWHHEDYDKYYPNGYELIWVDNVEENEELMTIINKHNEEYDAVK